jgi:hypothetical protein
LNALKEKIKVIGLSFLNLKQKFGAKEGLENTHFNWIFFPCVSIWPPPTTLTSTQLFADDHIGRN